MLADELLELIERIHLIPSGEVSWQDALAELSRIMDARLATLMAFDLQALEVIDYEYDDWPDSWFDAYTQYYVKLDRRIHFARANPRQRFIIDHDFIDESGIAHDEFYQDFLIPRGLKYYAAMMSPRNGEVPCVEVAINRATDQGPYTHADLVLLGAIGTHFVQVYESMHRTETRMLNGLLTTSALEQFTFPALIVDHDMELIWVNEAGQQLLASGEMLRCTRRSLHTARLAELSQLRELVGQACGSGLGARGGAMALSGCNGMQGCSVLVTPLHFAQDDIRLLRLQQRRFALLLVQLKDTDALQGLDFIQQLYGLSGQECRLLELLIAGQNLRGASEAMGVTYETARQYLKRLFGKTDTRSQSQLMRVVLEHPAFFVGMS